MAASLAFARAAPLPHQCKSAARTGAELRASDLRVETSVGELLGVKFHEMLQLFWQIVRGMDGVGGAGRNTRPTVNAAFGIDIHLGGSIECGFVFLWMNAIGGTDIDAQQIFDTGISYDVGHGESPINDCEPD